MLHERIRKGVMLRREPTVKQKKVAARMAQKAEKKARIKADSEAYQARRAGAKGHFAARKAKRLGSKRTAAVEAQWGTPRGQYHE